MMNLNEPRMFLSRNKHDEELEIEGSSAADSGWSSRILDAIISVSIVALFFGLPLFFTGATFQGIAFEKQMYFYFWILIALVSWVTRGVIEGELKIRRTPLDIPILIFWAAYLLSTFFSVDRWHSFWGFFGDPSRGFAGITAMILAYYVIVSHLSQKTEKRLKIILGFLIFGNLILSLWTILGLAGVQFLPGKLEQFAPLSLIGTVSGLGIYFSFMLPILMISIFKLSEAKNFSETIKKLFIALSLLVLISNIFILFAIYAFVSWIAVLAGASLFVIYVISRIVRPAGGWTWLPMAVFAGILVILMIGQVKIAKINLPVEVSPSYNLSFQVAKESLKDRLVLGSGPATYGYDFSLHRPKDFNLNNFYNLRFYQGTGIFFEALPTLGALGIIALLLLILSFVSVGIYLISLHKEKNKIYSLGLFTAALIILVSSLAIRIEGTIIILGALISILAIAVFSRESESEEKYLNLSLKASPKYALALAFIFMLVSAGVILLFVSLGKAYLADAYAGSSAREKEISEEGSINKLIKAANLNKKEGRYLASIAQKYMYLANKEAIKEEKTRDADLIGAYLNNSIAAAASAKNLMDKDVMINEILAQIYENAGLYVPDSLKLAEDGYRQAQALEPNNPDYFVKLGQIKISQAAASKDDNEKKNLVGQARDLFQKSLDEKSNYAPGYYQLSLAQEALADLDGAIDNMKKAFALDNSNINYAFNLARLFQARGRDEDNKIAEDLFKQILGVNDKEINTHFSLGLLYEKQNKKDEAIAEYKKVLDLLPDGSDDAKASVQKMIDNLKNGISNFSQNSAPAAENQMPEAPVQPETGQ